jgi:hypothetical protein
VSSPKAPSALAGAGRFRTFRYEIRLWRGGHIPDVAEAVDSPNRLSEDEQCARDVLDVVPHIPTPVWGRDELGIGEMWNSNSVIAWVIARSGIDAEWIQPPKGGRAPGWRAGLVVAHRQAIGATATATLKASPPSIADATFETSPERISGAAPLPAVETTRVLRRPLLRRQTRACVSPRL